MPQDATRELFNEVDANHDGKIDRSEFAQWANHALDEGVASSSINVSQGYFSGGSHAGTGIRTDTSYETDGHAAFDHTDHHHHTDHQHTDHHHHHNVIEQHGFVGDELAVGGELSITNYETIYSTDEHGFYLDPNPEIITCQDPSPALVYKQNIAIRFLQPPPLPPPGVSFSFVILLFVELIKN
jgi:hypothetical protein